MNVLVTIRRPGELGKNRLPIAFLWVDNVIYGSNPCGVLKPRVPWLPIWLPFNTRYDCSFLAQLQTVRQLKQLGKRIAYEREFLQVASGQKPGRLIVKEL